MAPRFQIEPRDIPQELAARRMGIADSHFKELLPQLFARGFPRPDETTGNFDLEAIDEWCRRRHPELFVISSEQARDARAVVNDRLSRLKHG